MECSKDSENLQEPTGSKLPRKGLSQILALDIATHTGWAHWGKGKIKFGTTDFTNNQWDGAGMRYLKFHTFLESMKFDVVVYESVMGHSSTYASHVYGGYLSVLQSYCELNEIPYTGYGVGEIKKHWTGKGNAKKDAMLKEAHSRGFLAKTDDEADALAILHLGLEEFSSLLAQ